MAAGDRMEQELSARSEAQGHAVHEHHWGVSWAPIAVSFGVLFLVPIAFAAHFVYGRPLLAIGFIGAGTPLILAGVAKWIQEGSSQQLAISDISPIGIGIFIVGEILIFGSLFASYWTMRISSGTAGEVWPPTGTPHIDLILPLFMTAMLVASSLTYDRAEQKFDAGEKGRFLLWLLLSIVLGGTFLACTSYEYVHLFREGFTPATNSYSTAFYSLTGFHASHVLVGLLAFLAIFLAVLIGRPHRLFIKVVGIYWHFVDVIWFFVASQVYYW